MVKYNRFVLDNGLILIINEDNSTPLVAVNILYKVGSRDEQPNKTGFAHLFEHLMFGGSKNISSFDETLQMVGGENNAFTTSDITNYYITLPSDNIETALWIESDRMLELDFSEEKLNIQQNVVIEEYRQRYLNQPYGDIWLLIRPLAFKRHPYKWPTIGENIEHIQKANSEDVRNFFYSHYAPNNAVLTLSGNISSGKGYDIVNKWFGDIEKRLVIPGNYKREPEQTEGRKITVYRKVPYDAIYKAWHIRDRLSKDYYVSDLITDLLSGGKSSRLYQSLVKEKKIFSEINAFVTGDIDPGLLIIGGKIMDGINIEEADGEIIEIINSVKANKVGERELRKVQNRFETTILQGNANILNKAMGLSYFEMLGDAELLNDETSKYCIINQDDICNNAKTVFKESNCSTIFYLSDK